MKNTFLIGMPGVGKSYWAEQIAAYYNFKFIDLDDIIAIKTGKTIAAFFAQYGDAAFRKIEHETLQQVMQVFATNTIIACGGGTPCFYHNLQRMKANGTVIYLEAKLDYLIQNLEKEKQFRPLLQQEDWQNQLGNLLAQRKQIYEQADFVLSAKSLSIKDFSSFLPTKKNN